MVLVLIPALWIAGFLVSTLPNENRQGSQRRGFSLVFHVMSVHFSFDRTQVLVHILCMCVFPLYLPAFSFLAVAVSSRSVWIDSHSIPMRHVMYRIVNKLMTLEDVANMND